MTQQPPTTWPAGLGPKRTKIITVAAAQVGLAEEPIGSNRGPGIDKFIPNWARTTPGPAWCCFCVWWVARQALGADPFDRHHGSCTKAWAAAIKAGFAVRNDGTRVPYPGDAFLVNGANAVDPDDMRHIGYVFRVSADGTEINTLEGNTGHRFKLGRRALNDGEIGGWIDFVPDEHPDGFERGLVAAPWTARSPTR